MMATTKRIVADTNLLISRLLLPGSVPGQAVRKAEREGLILASRATLGELADVLGRRKFDPYVSVEERQDYLRRLARTVDVVTVGHRVRLCRDPRDDKFLELALSGEADLILTGDQDILALDPFRGIPVITAREYTRTDQPSL